MVDTLAPKKIFTQRELGKSLTPSPVAAAIMQPAKNIMDMSPDQKMPGGVIEQQSDFLVDPNSCLLYTSPSPRDLSTSRMPSSA